MKLKRMLGALMAMVMVMGCTVSAIAEERGAVVVLYTNDVHCNVDGEIGYAGLAAYKKEMQEIYGEDNVTLVDAGDAVQGRAIGLLSGGSYITDIMNEVGYDICIPGNHEFDYGMERMQQLMGMYKGKVLSCNFTNLENNTLVYSPYTILSYGDTKIGYVGICTPESISKSTPKFFQNDEGEYIYGFCQDDTGAQLYAAVQNAVDGAIGEGADYIIAIGHLGTDGVKEEWSSKSVVANTTGIDAFIDGHSHSVLDGERYADKDGEEVVITSTGTGLAAIGRLVIENDGKIETGLVTEYDKKDADTDGFIKGIQESYNEKLKKVVAKSSVDLVMRDAETDEYLIRLRETNLGNFCADAYKTVLGADIGIVNGGGIRVNIEKGDITYEDVIAVHPFGNMGEVVEATGQEILDALEMSVHELPESSGGFLQVSGVTYKVDGNIPSSVETDSEEMFISVNGQYRVSDVFVNGEPLDLEKNYTVASHSYLVKNGGDGLNMFMDNEIVKEDVMADNEILIKYITDHLGGTIGEEYANAYGDGRIAMEDVQAAEEVAQKKAEDTQNAENAQKDEDAQMKAGRYTVKGGDSLWSISREILGRGADWTKIYDLNKDIINNPDKISRGQVLKMPAA